MTTLAAQAVNYFETFDLPVQFDVDSGDLRRQYYRVSRATHPDRIRTQDADADSLRLSAHANRAFEALSDPVARADHLLELAGGPSAADERTVPSEVLNQTLLLREEIDDAKSAGDEATLTALRGQVQAAHGRLLEQIAAVARRLPGDAGTRHELRRLLNSIPYYQRMLEQL